MLRKSISFTEQHDAWIKTRIASGEYTSDSEYIRDLIRRDQEANQRYQALKAAALQGLESGPSHRPPSDFVREAAQKVRDNRTLSGDSIKIQKRDCSLDYLNSVKRDTLESLQSQTSPVSKVDDPYKESDVAYIVIDIDPCNPLIREVPKGTANSFPTLADAKEAARQIIQSSVAKAQKSLIDLRQIGIDNITYISL